MPVLGLVVACAGCYTYRNVQGPNMPARGEWVRTRLTPEGRTAVETRVGRRIGDSEGEFAGSDGDSLYLDMDYELSRLEQYGFGTGLDTLGIPHSAVRTVQVRELNRVRTGGLIAGATLGGWMLFVGATEWFGGDGGSAPGQPSPPGDALRAQFHFYIF